MNKKTAAAPLLALCSALLFCAATSAAEPRLGRFERFDTGDYVIVTSRGARQAQQFVEDLRKFRVTLEKTLGKRASDNRFPTTIVVVSARDWTGYLQPREGVAGWFQPAPFANYITMNGDVDREMATPLIFHEYTHYYLASQFSGEYPPWFNEGFAELMGYATFKVKPGTAILRIPTFRVMEARDRDWIPFERLIAVDHYSPEYQSHKLANEFYAQAWLTVQYGIIENRVFGKQIFDYLNRRNTLHPHEEAARLAFGADLTVPDKQLREYSRNTRMNSGAINIGEIPPVTMPAGVPVPENDALAIFIDLMLNTRGAPDRIRPLVKALEKREPHSARTSILVARLAAHEDDDAAFEAAAKQAEAALAPGDWLARRDLASVLLTRGTEFRALAERDSDSEQRELERAMKWFGEAITHNDQDVIALWGFGTSAVRLNQNLDLAEDALVKAYKLAPAGAQIAMSLANLNSRQNKPEAMVPFLEDTIRYATNLPTRRWAADTLLEMRRYLKEREEYEAESKKQREAYEKQLADYEKKYGKAKKKK